MTTRRDTEQKSLEKERILFRDLECSIHISSRGAQNSTWSKNIRLESAGRKAPQRETQAVLGRWSGGRCSKARVQKLENSCPKPGRMEKTLEGGRGPPQAVAPLDRERLKSTLYTSLKHTKITPTCFRSYVIHHQAQQSCAWLELLVVVHRYFVVCLVGVWQRNFEPVVCVYGTAGWPASHTVHTHTHTHTTGSKLRCQTPTKHTTKYLWTTTSNSSQAQLSTPWWWIT